MKIQMKESVIEYLVLGPDYFFDDFEYQGIK